MENIRKDEIYKELGIILAVSLLFIIIFKALFLKDSLWNIIKLVASFVFIILIPSMSILFYFRKKLNFIERTIISALFGSGALGVISYNLGIIGIHIKHHYFIIPLILLAIGIFINLRFPTKEDSEQ